MAKIRIYELARQANMTNKALLEKLKEMNIPFKSHMSVLDEETTSRVKEFIWGKSSEVIVEKRVKDTVIRRRRKIIKRVPDVQEVAPAARVEGEIPAKVKKEEIPGTVKDEPEKIKPPVPEEVPKEEAKPSLEPTKKIKVRKRERKKEEPAKIIKLPEPEAVPPVSVGVTAREVPAKPKAGGVVKLKIGQKKVEHRRTVSPTEKMPPETLEEDRRFLKKKISFRKKAVLEKADLYDKKVRRGRRERVFRKGKVAMKGEKPVITTPKAIKRRIKIDEAIMVSELAKRMGIKASEVIKHLMSLGIIASLNQAIDFETASLVASEFNYEVEKASFEEEEIIQSKKDDIRQLKDRPPVVTIMGHVDHGKTSLLDAIRQTNVIGTEAGGITQHIGAYYVSVNDRQVVFLDTPGHEAFTAMRARGAEITDLVVLVVAADDGVMPQTIEAINHAKAAGVPILVAVNKIDKPDANPERVQRELAEYGLSPEAWGGDTIFVNVSAKEKIGIEELLDMILLQADVLELKANPDKLARGHVIEARLDPGKGPVATVLVQEGTLHAGDAIVCGLHYGKLRAMVNDRGNRLDKAGPSMPVEIQGLSGVPMAGDEFVAVADEKLAKQVSSHRRQKHRMRELVRSSKLTLEKYYEQMKGGLVKDLNLIIRADVQGSIEALADALHKLPSTEIKVNIVHSATGAITESDIMLAAVSKAIILGFNVRPNPKVKELANEQGVDIRFYDVIYNVVNDIKAAMAGLMEPTYKEHILGRVEVRQTFNIPKVGTIAGCYVTEGKIQRGQPVRLLRDGVVIYDGKISSLRRFKDDVKEVQSGYECGLGIENYNDIKVGDVIECYYMEEIKPVVE